MSWAKLAALIPPPRLNLVRYHGILAPDAHDRGQVVPSPPTPPPPLRPHRLFWAALLACVFSAAAFKGHVVIDSDPV